MNSKEIIKKHIEKGAAPTFKGQKLINGGVLTIPKNMIRQIPEQEYIYEIDGDVITIYRNQSKINTIKCKYDYASRLFIILDIIARSTNQGYKFSLTQVFRESGKLVKKEAVTAMFDVLSPLENVDKEMEKVLFEAMKKIIYNDDSVISDDILDGYEFIMSHYLEVRKNES